MPPSMAQLGPTRSPSRITVSKEMSAARKLGTVVRTHTPRVSGTSKNASNPSVWLRLRRSAKSRRWNVRARARALATDAATPSLTSKVIRMRVLVTPSMYRDRCARIQLAGA